MLPLRVCVYSVYSNLMCGYSCVFGSKAWTVMLFVAESRVFACTAYAVMLCEATAVCLCVQRVG